MVEFIVGCFVLAIGSLFENYGSKKDQEDGIILLDLDDNDNNNDSD